MHDFEMVYSRLIFTRDIDGEIPRTYCSFYFIEYGIYFVTSVLPYMKCIHFDDIFISELEKRDEIRATGDEWASLAVF